MNSLAAISKKASARCLMTRSAAASIRFVPRSVAPSPTNGGTRSRQLIVPGLKIAVEDNRESARRLKLAGLCD